MALIVTWSKITSADILVPTLFSILLLQELLELLNSISLLLPSLATIILLQAPDSISLLQALVDLLNSISLLQALVDLLHSISLLRPTLASAMYSVAHLVEFLQSACVRVTITGCGRLGQATTAPGTNLKLRAWARRSFETWCC